MSYATRTAIAGLWREKWINILCAFTIASGLLIISTSSLVVFNLHTAMKRMPDRFSIMVFLKEKVEGRPGQLINKLEAIDGVKGVRYISSEQALKDLRGAVDDPDFVLEGLEDNPLPGSLEIKLNRASVSDSTVEKLAKKAEEFEEVDDVYYASNVLKVIQSLRFYVEGAGLALVGLLTMAVLFVSYSTVKLLLYRKQDEIDTLKYLGATKAFIRAPFMIEGAILGTAAGAMALAGLLGSYAAVLYKLGGHLPLLKSVSLPMGILAALPVAGLVIGVAGALLAVGKIRF